MSVDGYIAGPNGEMEWMVWNWDDELKNYVKDLTDPVDCIILGRKLAQGFIPYWNSVPDAEGALKIINTGKVVFSNTLEKTEWENTVLANGPIREEILKLKEQEGGDIIVYGGAAFVASLIKHALIDEFHLFINPTAIGDGMAIFKDIENRQNLMLVNSATFKCGIVVLHYNLKHS